jgi:SAM-dependent methyltransferase
MSWYARWFSDEMYMELYSHRDAAEARPAVELFQRITGLAARETTLLDLACGTGRHAFEFARLGYRVLAADLSPTLLGVAHRKSQKFHASVLLVRCDMRRLPLYHACDAVAQLFTAFGYFPSDEENEHVFAEVARVLRPGGWYMLDFLNADAVRASLQNESTTLVGGSRIRQVRSIEAGRVEKRISILDEDGERSFTESVRLFTRGDLEAMLARRGFHVRFVFGNYDGAPFDATSPRCIVFSRYET